MIIFKAIRKVIDKYKYWVAWCLPICMISVTLIRGDVSVLPSVVAQGVGPSIDTVNNSMANMVSLLNGLLKVMYLLLWPLLVVAGMALDNSLVLGAAFHLDTALWKFWTIMTTFANFALGLVVLFNIVKYILGFNDDTKDVFDTIKKAFLAGVGIQISRFVLLALIDISSVAIYAVGAMPLKVIPNTELSTKPVLTMHSNIDFGKMNDQSNSNKDEGFTVYYSCGDQYYAPCQLTSGFVTGPINTDHIGEDASKIDASSCVIGGMYATDNVLKVPGADNNTCVSLYKHGGGTGPNGCTIKDISQVTFTPPDCETLTTIFGKSKGFVGLMVTIYSSLLDFANINLTSEQMTTGGALVVFLLKLLIALALVVPLVALAVVLLVRVAYLRLIIAFAPILVIKNIFFKDAKIIGNMKIGGAELGDSWGDIIGAIFMPVGVVFALSIGIIFLTLTIDNLNPADQVKSAQMEKEFGFTRTPSNDDMVVYQLTPATEVAYKIPQESYALSMFLDFFTYILVNLFAIGLIWILFFAAMKSSKFLGEIGGRIDSTGRKILGSLPIIPLPGGGKVGVSTAFGTGYDSLLGKASEEVLETTRKMNEASMNKLFGDEKIELLDDKQKSSIVSSFYQGDGSSKSIQDAAANVLGKGYNEADNTYEYQIVDEIIKQATDDTKKKKAAQLMIEQLKAAPNKEAVQEIVKRWGGLRIDQATAPEAYRLIEGIGTLEIKDAQSTINYKLLIDKNGKITTEGLEAVGGKKLGDKELGTLLDSYLDPKNTESFEASSVKSGADPYDASLRSALSQKVGKTHSDISEKIVFDISKSADKKKRCEWWLEDSDLEKQLTQYIDKQGGWKDMGEGYYLKTIGEGTTKKVVYDQDRVLNIKPQGVSSQTWEGRVGSKSLDEINTTIRDETTKLNSSDPNDTAKKKARADYFAGHDIAKDSKTYAWNSTSQQYEEKK